MLIAEELGQRFLGYAGNTEAETPFLDELSRKSVTFNHHFTVHSKCVPSRAALYSGRYCHNGGHRTLGIALQENEISLADILRKHGYYNILAMKNHTVDTSILMQQFHEHWTRSIDDRKPFGYNDFTAENCSHPGGGHGEKHADNYLLGRLNIAETEVQDYMSTERACKFITEYDRDQPFFMNINYDYVHPPYAIMEPYYSHFMEKELTLFPNHPGENKPDFLYKMSKLYGFDRLSETDRKEILACYYGQLKFIDIRVREIYEALEKSGKLDNTVLIFTSDHGDMAGHYGIPEKWDTLFSDFIMNIPLIIHFPERFKPLSTNALTENVDILPLLLELTGIEAPYGIQGSSPYALMTGESDRHKDYVFGEGGHEKELLEIDIEPMDFTRKLAGYKLKWDMREKYPDSLRKAKMIRSDKYKLVYRIKDKHEFYNLEDDPLEMDNLYDAPDYQPIIAELKDKLLRTLIETEDNLPFDPVPFA